MKMRPQIAHPRWEQVVRPVESVEVECWSEFRDKHIDWGPDMALYVARRHCGFGSKELAIKAGGPGIARIFHGLSSVRSGCLHEIMKHAGQGGVAVALNRFAHKLKKDQDLGNIRDQDERQLYK